MFLLRYSIFFILLVSLTTSYGQPSRDTIILDEVSVIPFIKDKNFISTKGKSSTISPSSYGLLVSEFQPKKNIKVRGIEFFFKPSNPEVCTEIYAEILILKREKDGKFIPVIQDKEIYYYISTEKVTHKIFDLRDYNIDMNKNEKYYIGLKFLPEDDCQQFHLQSRYKKGAKSLVAAYSFNDEKNKITEIRDNSLYFKVFYEK